VSPEPARTAGTTEITTAASPNRGRSRRGALHAAAITLLAAVGLGEVAAKQDRMTAAQRRKRGKTGAGGPPGSPGSPGEKGGQGEKGDKGDNGDPGSPGGKGDKGDPGDKGDKGDTGDKGDPGLQTITITDGNAISPSGILATSTATCPDGATAIGGGWTSAIVSNCDVARNARSELDARSWEVTLVCFNGSATAFKAQAMCLS
jgi:Collagen triple helix repeat (20 copies)